MITVLRQRGRLAAAPAVGAALLNAAAFAQSYPDADHPDQSQGGMPVHENGIGPDPDHDTNPATDTRVLSFIADHVEPSDDSAYTVVTFEPPPGKHGEAIRQDYAKPYGVKFGRGLTWQICEGQRRFKYDTMCTYDAAPSGRYAAGYLNYLNTPLLIEFDRPVCVVTMAIYPTGGKEGEPFEFAIQGWTKDDEKIATSKADFRWTNKIVRWNNMAGAYFVGQRAAKITVSMRSKDRREAGETLRYLIDNLAFVDEGCEEALADIKDRTGVDLLAQAEEPGGFTPPLTTRDAYREFIDKDQPAPCVDKDGDGACDLICDWDEDGAIDEDTPDICYLCEDESYDGDCGDLDALKALEKDAEADDADAEDGSQHSDE